jgi:phosphate transport system substrate-binding protein
VGKPRLAALGGAIVLALAMAACGDDSVPLSGSIQIGSSATVAPLTEAIARRFMAENPDVRISVVRSSADTDVTPEKIMVANDAVILMVNRRNPVSCLTTAQLKQIWHRDSEVSEQWNQVDDLDPPYDGDMTAYGPGTDTETFAFFNTVVNGRVDSYRDYNNVLHDEAVTVDAIANSNQYFGYADHPAYVAKRKSVKAIAVDSGEGCVAPTPRTIADGSFRPLSRRLYVHPSAQSLARRTMKSFLQYYLDNAETVATEVGFVPLTDEQLSASRARLERLIEEAERGAARDVSAGPPPAPRPRG